MRCHKFLCIKRVVLIVTLLSRIFIGNFMHRGIRDVVMQPAKQLTRHNLIVNCVGNFDLS